MNSNTKPNDILTLTPLLAEVFTHERPSITPLAGAGSNRRYYLLECNGKKAVGTCGDDFRENKAFVELCSQFSGQFDFIPEILAVDSDYRGYIQSFAGHKSLFYVAESCRNSNHYTPEIVSLLEKAMRQLADIQVKGGKNLDYSLCYPTQSFDRRLVRWDLNYFKYSFLKPSGIEFDETRLQDEFDILEDLLMKDAVDATFMYRDFQSRNVMVGDNGKLTFIDFQSGRRGPAQYDVASFIWQAKAKYPATLKQSLLEAYLQERGDLDREFDAERFKAALPLFVLFRTLQTLGAYGFRGWVERKAHFLLSIPAGVDNLYSLLTGSFLPAFPSGLQQPFPYLAEIARILSEKFGSEAEADRHEPFRHFIPASENPLTVTVTSFSYKKGIPVDSSGNGGGFVFDCRAPHNPGRYEQYKRLTGLDAPVRKFLEEDGEILPFISECEKIVDASVERYLQRGFSSLSVNFGCTGGQHRSVYSADTIARHLNKKYGVRVLLSHREQDIAEEFPAADVTVEFDSWLKKMYTPCKQ